MLSTQPHITNGFPAELDDREWLAARYGSLGEETIAAELRVSCKAVRRARERLGIATSPNAATAVASSSTNGASHSANGASRSANGASPAGKFVSDEELTRRVAQVKKGLTDSCARLTGLIHDLEWVRQHVAPPTVKLPGPRA